MSGAWEIGQEGHTDVRLELLRGTPEISGAVLDARGVRQAFSGWLELVSLLEALRGASTERESVGGD